MRLTAFVFIAFILFVGDASAQVGRTGSCGRCDSWLYDGEGGPVVEQLANGRTETNRWCKSCYREHLAEQKSDKIPEWSKEDYEYEARYWDKQGEILDRLGKEVRVFDGKEILVPKGSPESDAWWSEYTKNDPDKKSWDRPEKAKSRYADSTESIKKPSSRKPARIIIIDPDGTVTLIGF